MHRIIHSIRLIPAAELPKVKDIDGIERTATAQHLLNLGIVALGGDLYSCAVQEQSEDGRSWTPAVTLPGTELTRGKPTERFRRLPSAERAKVMRAEVERTSGTGSKKKTEALTVIEAEIASGDVVKKRDIIPHMWAGERDR